MEVFIEQALPWSRNLRIHIREGDHIAQPITFVKPANEATYNEPALTIKCEVGQAFMDALWQAGFKPSEGTGSAGSLKATQDHLHDMRKMVFIMMDEVIPD